MNNNKNLHEAKRNKNDEFYTQYSDIEREIQAYIDYDPEVFKGKTILCPCNDGPNSNFTKYFLDNFKKLGLKRLICVEYNKEGKGRYLDITGEAFSA